MKRILAFVSVVLLCASLSLSAGCERLVTEVVHDTTHDTTYINRVTTKIDTVTLTRTDTVVTVTTVPVLRVDTTYVTRKDTLYLPGQVTHDTSWVYLQTNPTNPYAGGDEHSGLMVMEVYPTYYAVWWHGHFMGVLSDGGESYPSYQRWWAWGTVPDNTLLMSVFCKRSTWQEAAQCLAPIEMTLGPATMRAKINR